MEIKYGQPAVNILRSEFHRALMDEIKKQGIEIKYEKRLVHITDEPNNPVTAYFEDGTMAQGDMVIGADGIHSRTREIILPNGPKPDYIGLQWVAGALPMSKVPAFQPTDQSLYMTFGQKGFFGYGNFNRKESILMWWVNLSREKALTPQEIRNFSNRETKEELLEMCKDWHTPIEELIENTTNFIKGNVHDIQSLPTWHKDRVVLIGDSAHAVSPNSGQGASLALEDAMFLTKLLKQKPDQLEWVFSEFEKSRKSRVEKIIAEGRRSGDGKKEMTPFSAWVRDQILKIVLPLFTEKGNRWVHEYKIYLED